jgi:hypothetical protein
VPDKDKIREIRDRLHAIVPPADERSSARELARSLAAAAQVLWTRMLAPGDGINQGDLTLLCAQFAACHALEALRDLSTEAADEVALQITDAWLHAPGVGEWIWEHLGEDAEAVAALADELARATAAEAVSRDA